MISWPYITEFIDQLNKLAFPLETCNSEPMRYLIILGTLLIFTSCTYQNPKSTSSNEISDSTLYVSVVLAVNGMTCEGCENAITKGVENLEGIREVKASHIDSIAIVVYDSSLIGVDLIAEKIIEIGYEVKGIKK